ncbi:prolyl oligopeptidase family serine peptidase [Niabella aquatica]
MRLLDFLFLTIIICSCNSHPRVTNYISNINNCDSEVVIRNWEFTNLVYLEKNREDAAIEAFKDTINADLGDQLKNYADFSKYFNKVAQEDTIPLEAKENFRYGFTQTGSYFSVDTLYRLPKVGFFHDVLPKYTYAATIIRSTKEQEVVLIPAANNGIRLWVNGEQKLLSYVHDFISGYQYLVKVRLKKGDNFILAKLLHGDGDWRFFLKACSIAYATENSLGRDYFSVCENYLLHNERDTLKLRITSPATVITRPVKLEISDVNRNVVIEKMLPVGHAWEIPVVDLPTGPYTVKLNTDNETFKQRFFKGDYHTWFNKMIKNLEQFYTDDQARAHIEILGKRFRYVDSVDVNHDNPYERKLSALLFEIAEIHRRLKNKQSAFAHIPGLHLRNQIDKEHEEDSYMIYVPESYNGKPVPLVVMMPYESSVRPFNISTYVSNIERIEHIKKLAEKYRFAVLWSSYRVYTNHNFINMFCNTVFERINDVKKDYHIDSSRIFVYGDCAGGALALYMAGKYPSYFAALAAEGPAIPGYGDNEEDDHEVMYSQRDAVYNFYNTPENFKNFSSYIVHSVNDEKSSFDLSQGLYDRVKKAGGNIKLKKLYVRKGTDLFFMNLVPENKIMTDIFAFFNTKKKVTPNKIAFSTRLLKYNHCFWVTLDDIAYRKKAYVNADFSESRNSITITAQNVNRLTLDLSQLKIRDKKEQITVMANGRPGHYSYPENNQLSISLSTDTKSEFLKNHDTEGPVNDFFSRPFLLVYGSGGSVKEQALCKAIADSFALNWKANFLAAQFSIKKDVEVNDPDIKNYNLIVVGNNNTNALLDKVYSRLPVKIEKQYITIGGRHFDGTGLSYTFIYPNPLNTAKYILVIGSNGDKFNYEMIKDLSFNGWEDFYVNSSSGEFDQHWQ